jgi:hypothetical protein
MSEKKVYRALRALPASVCGAELKKGEEVELMPRKAAYLLGTHLELAESGARKSTKTGGKA